MYYLENEELKVAISEIGAEITSVIKKKENRECIWDADPKAWKRHSPVLFPLVGRYKDNTSVFEGRSYTMGQHGFARDMEFELISGTETEISFLLKSSDETLAKYPFEFELTCGYAIKGSTVEVIWKVHNPSDKTMYFSIGGHPAFVGRKPSLTGATLKFDTDKDLSCRLVNSEGLLMNGHETVKLTDGCVEVDEHFFDKDALVIEDDQCHEISIIEDGVTLVTVRHSCPLFGVWSSNGKNNPFICIEPWYGRADKEDFAGELQDREYGNTLKAKETFNASYTMTF